MVLGSSPWCWRVHDIDVLSNQLIPPPPSHKEIISETQIFDSWKCMWVPDIPGFGWFCSRRERGKVIHDSQTEKNTPTGHPNNLYTMRDKQFSQHRLSTNYANWLLNYCFLIGRWITYQNSWWQLNADTGTDAGISILYLHPQWLFPLITSPEKSHCRLHFQPSRKVLASCQDKPPHTLIKITLASCEIGKYRTAMVQ